MIYEFKIPPLGKGAFISDDHGNPTDDSRITWKRNRFGQHEIGVIYITTPISEGLRG